MPEPFEEIEITTMFGYVLLPIDEDGTPLSHGELMVEVEPGVWKSPALIEVEEYLAKHVGLLIEKAIDGRDA